jgi:hypothetical protein
MPVLHSMDPAAIMDEILQLYSRKLEGRRIRVTRRYRGQLPGQRLFRRVAAVAGQSSGERVGCHGGRRFSASPRGHGPRLVRWQGGSPHHGGRQRQRDPAQPSAANLRTFLHHQEGHRVPGSDCGSRAASSRSTADRFGCAAVRRALHRNRVLHLPAPAARNQPGGVIRLPLSSQYLQASEVQ